MYCYICETCGTQHAPAPEPPSHCAICEDDRQYVGWRGQTWLTHEDLKGWFSLRVEQDDGLLGIGVRGEFAIPQRALLLRTGGSGNVLWECVSLVTDEAIGALKARGGVDQIVISHPHFYSSMIEWSEALGGVPILLHEADRDWIRRSSRNVHFWSGDVHRLSNDVTLVRCGGHFPGSTALLWRAANRSMLFPGDALQVATDRRHVAFMYSYPNYVPMKTSEVRAMRERLAGYDFDDVYGFTWGRNIIGNGRAAVDASFDRHLRMVES